jgi:hypothetical protein
MTAKQDLCSEGVLTEVHLIAGPRDWGGRHTMGPDGIYVMAPAADVERAKEILRAARRGC